MHLDTQSVQGIIQSPAQRLTAVQKFQVGESRLPLRFEMIYSCMPAWSEVGLPKEYRVLKKEGASSRNFVYTLSLAIKQKKSGKFKNHATYNMPLSVMSLHREAKLV